MSGKPAPGTGGVTGAHGWTEANAAEIAAVIDEVIAQEAARVTEREAKCGKPYLEPDHDHRP